MLRRSGHDTPPSWDSASVIGARGAPQNAVRSALVASAGGPLSGSHCGVGGGVSASPSSSISSYSEVRRAVASAALDSLNTSASPSSASTTNWIDELLLGSSVGTGEVHDSPSSCEVLR